MPDIKDLNDQWYKPQVWDEVHAQAAELDKLTEAFNEEVGLNLFEFLD